MMPPTPAWRVTLADTLKPEAFERGRPLNSMAMAGGFVLSFILSL